MYMGINIWISNYNDIASDIKNKSKRRKHKKVHEKRENPPKANILRFQLILLLWIIIIIIIVKSI